jgi:hypothetical protein
MVFKVNHLGKVKSSFMLDPHLLEETKVQASKRRLTTGNIIEEALRDYLHMKQKQEEELRRQQKQKKKELEENRSSFNFY